jgi:hypothetical protein
MAEFNVKKHWQYHKMSELTVANHKVTESRRFGTRARSRSTARSRHVGLIGANRADPLGRGRWGHGGCAWLSAVGGRLLGNQSWVTVVVHVIRHTWWAMPHHYDVNTSISVACTQFPHTNKCRRISFVLTVRWTIRTNNCVTTRSQEQNDGGAGAWCNE